MASSFFGLYVQRDGLQLAQKGLDITGHNITNIKTEGYTRQRLDIVSVANTAGALGYNSQVNLAGKGADAVGVTQIRDKLLDAKVRRYSAELCDTGAKTTILADIEDILDDVENQDAGLSAIFGEFKSAFQSFSATGADRQDLSTVAMNSANSVINVIKNFDMRLNDVEISTREDIQVTNERVNTVLRQLASLNKQIKDSYVQMNNVFATRDDYQAEVDYGPLELKDNFNKLCDELAQYVNISVEQQTDGTYDIFFGDVALVKNDAYAKTDIIFSDKQENRNDFAELHVSSLNTDKGWTKCEREITDAIKAIPNLEEQVNTLNSYIYSGKIKQACDLEKKIIAAAGDAYDPIFTNNMTPAQLKIAPSYAITVTEETDKLTGGSINGLFDMYNGKGCYAKGNENAYNGIKYYQETIRAFANKIVEAFNSVYDDYNKDPETIANGTQFKMFEFEGGALKDGNVSDLKIAESWKNNVLRCVHPKVDKKGDLDYNYDQLDNTYINKILSAFEDKYKFGNESDEYTFEGFIQFYGQTVGGDLEYELGSFDSTNIMLKSVSDARDEVMGVSMDEEGVNMMNYQKWYNAISRMISALDECLDKLINGTGKVGL
ncbi:MAG: flagellar hook-associated protein FlgK [Huintestinicola sp.]